jgi:hypothetical protein
MRDDAIIADGEPVGLVRLSVDYENVRMFVTHDLKAHAFLPREHHNSHRKRGGRPLIIS